MRSVFLFLDLNTELEFFVRIVVSAMVPWATQDAYEDPCLEKITSESLLALPQLVYFTLYVAIGSLPFQGDITG